MIYTSELTLNVYVPIFFNSASSPKNIERRIRYFAEQVLQLSSLNLRFLRITAYTNDASRIPQGIWSPLKSMRGDSSFKIIECSDRELVNASNQYEPQLLTWKHKLDLRKDIAAGDLDSVYLYLEDDALFTQANLEYFLKFRKILRRCGLIPSFFRAEWSSKLNLWIDSDAFERIDFDCLFGVEGETEAVFHQPANPYCALILLDQELANEYVVSDSFDITQRKGRDGLIWDTAASSAIGLIYENVPSSFIHRMAIPLKADNHMPLIGSLVRHQGDRYANEIWWKHYRLFDERLLPNLPVPTRNFIQKTLRFSKEYRKIMAKLIKRLGLYD